MPVLVRFLLACEACLAAVYVAGIHEWLGKYSRNALPDGEYRTAFHQTGTWMLVLGPPFVAVVALIWRRFRSLLTIHPTVARRYRLGFGLYILGSLGFEYAANLVSYGTGMKIVQVVLEESAEMVAVTFLIWATIELLQIRGIRLLDTSPAPDSVEQAA